MRHAFNFWSYIFWFYNYFKGFFREFQRRSSMAWKFIIPLSLPSTIFKISISNSFSLLLFAIPFIIMVS